MDIKKEKKSGGSVSEADGQRSLEQRSIIEAVNLRSGDAKAKTGENKSGGVGCLTLLSPVDGKPMPTAKAESCVCPYCGVELSLAYRISKLPKNATISQIFAEISRWEEEVCGPRHGSCEERNATSGRLDDRYIRCSEVKPIEVVEPWPNTSSFE
jgi:hypothetical protein